MTITPGTRLDRYEIVSFLGKGGMGEVYLAEDARLRRKVAIKLLSAKYTLQPDRIRRFEQEAETASRLNHPSIITIHEIGQVDGAYYLVTEYIEGQTLREHIKQSRLNVNDALDVAIQIAGAVAAAHTAHVLHRDIKPENVMLRPDGLVKVLDFGLAKLMEEHIDGGSDAPTRNETDSGVVAGTVQYMSPEQARGEKLDDRTDIFSLGVVLYEMVTGVSPFGGGSQAEVFARILERTPVPISHHVPDAPFNLDQIVSKALSKNLSERYATAQALLTDLSDLKRKVDIGTHIQQTRSVSLTRKHFAVIVLALLVLLITAGAGAYFLRGDRRVLTDRDTILLSDFANTTGDVVFDGALKQGLAVQLEQSPFLDVFQDARVRQTLQLMGRSQDERITREVAREVCLRAGLKAFIVGSIARIGSNYVVGLEAVNSQTGDVFARGQEEAATKEQVLKTLSQATRKLREQLGESLSSIRKFDAPLELTTSSLEALKALSLGTALFQRGKFRDAIGFFRTATELDPNFAYAYDGLAVAYLNTQQPALATQLAEKAFALRDRVTELEKLRITYFHYYFKGDFERTEETLELYQQAYPRDYRPSSNLADLATRTGDFEKGVEAAREAIRLNSPSFAPVGNLSENLLRLNRFAEAKEVSTDALKRGLGNYLFHDYLYSIAFVNGDETGMREQIGAMGAEPDAHMSLDWQADTFAFRGQLQSSQDLSQHAVHQSLASGAKGPDFVYRAKSAFRGAVLNRCADANSVVLPAETIDIDPVGWEFVAIAWALCGDEPRGQAVIREISKQFPESTAVSSIALPEVVGALALHRLKPQEAIDALQISKRYEAAAGFRPQYLRALAYLQLRSADDAAAEFQKILDHRGQAPLSVLYPLAQLGLARSAALGGYVVRARKAYETLFAEWKDADRDLPPLQAAKQEYLQLTSR
jgi:tetratricopeptide (TPR) repeat protein